MTEQTSDLDFLRIRYLERIRDAERDLAVLRDKLRLIEGLIGELDAESKKRQTNKGAATVDDNNITPSPYANMGLSDAAFDTVQTLGAGDGVTAATVAKYLLEKGFKPKGKNFKVSVGTALTRLANGRIITKLHEGSRVYMPKGIGTILSEHLTKVASGLAQYQQERLNPNDAHTNGRPSVNKIEDIVQHVIQALPKYFTTTDVMIGVGMDAKENRAAIKLAIKRAIEAKTVSILEHGAGRRATKYEKIDTIKPVD